MSCFWSDSLMRGSRPGAPEPTLDSFTIALHFSFFPAEKMMSGKSPFEKNSNNNKNTIPTCYLYFVNMHHFYHWLDNVRKLSKSDKIRSVFSTRLIINVKILRWASRRSFTFTPHKALTHPSNPSPTFTPHMALTHPSNLSPTFPAASFSLQTTTPPYWVQWPPYWLVCPLDLLDCPVLVGWYREWEDSWGRLSWCIHGEDSALWIIYDFFFCMSKKNSFH